MALQLGALRDALKEAGASDELARKASEEVAGYEHRFAGVEQKIDALDRKMDQRFAALEAKTDQRLAAIETRFAIMDGKLDKLMWAVTTIGALTLLTLGKVWFG